MRTVPRTKRKKWSRGGEGGDCWFSREAEKRMKGFSFSSWQNRCWALFETLFPLIHLIGSLLKHTEGKCKLGDPDTNSFDKRNDGGGAVIESSLERWRVPTSWETGVLSIPAPRMNTDILVSPAEGKIRGSEDGQQTTKLPSNKPWCYLVSQMFPLLYSFPRESSKKGAPRSVTKWAPNLGCRARVAQLLNLESCPCQSAGDAFLSFPSRAYRQMNS